MTSIKKRAQGYLLDDTFELLEPLQRFFLETATMKPGELVKKLKKEIIAVCGKLNDKIYGEEEK